jgi:hypothetical protein
MARVAVEKRATNSRGQLFYVAVWSVVTMFLVVATQVVNVPQALGDDQIEGQVDAAADFPLTGADPTEHEDPSVVYGGMLWTVTDARAIDAAEGLFERSRIEVDVSMTNTLSAAALRVPDSMVALVAVDGSDAIQGRFVDAGSRLSFGPGEEVDITIDFEVVDHTPELRDFVLQIAEPNRVPASIQLGSEQEAHDYPVLAAVDASPLATLDPDDSTRQIVVEPVAASIDVNAGPYRAALDEELAVVKVEVQRTESNDDAAYLQNGYWSLEVDGELVPAILVARSAETATNTDEVTLLFAFAAEAEELTVVGAGGTTDQITFSVVEPN